MTPSINIKKAITKQNIPTHPSAKMIGENKEIFQSHFKAFGLVTECLIRLELSSVCLHHFCLSQDDAASSPFLTSFLHITLEQGCSWIGFLEL